MATPRLPRLNINDVTITPKKEGDSLLLLDEKVIKEQFKARGVILFRGFDFDVDTFDNFTQRFCASSVYNQSAGRGTIKASANIQTVNLGNAPFALHPELARVPWKPDVCFSPVATRLLTVARLQYATVCKSWKKCRPNY